jgi:hypothetical protein
LYKSGFLKKGSRFFALQIKYFLRNYLFFFLKNCLFAKYTYLRIGFAVFQFLFERSFRRKCFIGFFVSLCFFFKYKTKQMNIYVGNLSWSVTSDDLFNLFTPFGEVASAKVVPDKFHKERSGGFGFVEMPDDEAARNAISNLNGQEVSGRKIVVNESSPRKEGGGGDYKKKSFGGGGGGGYRNRDGGGYNRHGDGGGGYKQRY